MRYWHPNRTRARRLASASVSLLLFALPVLLCAQSRPVVRCDTLVGWNGVAREGRFAPVLVSLENAGSRLDVEVRVDVAWGAGIRSPASHRVFARPAELPSGGTRRVAFVIPVRRDGRSLRVSVLSQGAEVAGEEVDLRPVGGPERFVAAVSSEMTLDALSDLSRPGAPVRVVYPRVDDLPESWAAYDGISTLVVHDTSFQELHAAQVAAIERWVVSGGTLVFTGGVAALQHSAAGFDRLLPVQVSGTRDAGGLAGLSAFLGGREPPRARVVLAESTVVAGAALAVQDGIPLVVQRRLGAGTIWFASFDPASPPLDSWPGWLGFWQRVTEGDRAPAMETTFRDPVDDPWVAALLDSPPLAFPSIIVALVFIAGYFLLMLSLLVGRFSRTLAPTSRAVLMLGVSVVAGLAGWLLFNRVMLRPAPSVLEAGRVEVVSGDGLALVTDRLGLFATRAGSCSLIVETPDVAVEEISSRGPQGDHAAPLEIDVDRRMVLRDVSLGRFGSRMFALQAVVPFAVDARLAASESALRVELVNGSARTLRGLFLLHDGKGYAIGDLAPGASEDRDLEPGAGIDVHGRDAAARLCADPRRAALLGRAGLEAGSDMVAGWIDGPVLAVREQGARRPADRPPLTLVTVRLQ